MTIIYRANEIQGLSTDIKPTLLPTNSSFFETDTLKTFNYDGTNWVLSGVGGSVSNAELDGSINYNKLSLTGAILNADLAGSISNDKLAGSISLTKLANGTQGKIIGFNSSTGVIEEQSVVGGSSSISLTVAPQSTTISDYTTPSTAVGSSVNVPTGASIEYLVVGGGGGGGFYNGGASGEYRTNVVGQLSGGGASAESSYTVSLQTYAITVGAGGTAGGNGVAGGTGGTLVTVDINEGGTMRNERLLPKVCCEQEVIWN